MRLFTPVFPILLLVGMLLCAAPGVRAQGGVGFYGAPEAGPAPLEVHFHYFGDDAVVSAISGWAWDFGDGSTSAEDFTTHTYENPGKYTVSLKVTFKGGETRTETKQDYITVTSGSPAEENTQDQPEERAEESAEETAETKAEGEEPGEGDDVVFIHHSCGENWLNSGLHRALLAKEFINERNDITYGVDVRPDPGRPDSLGPTPGELTDMNHWVLWFNDYLGTVRKHGCADGVNRIVIFKSCFPNSHVDEGGSEPGDPFSDWKTVANYQAVYRHPEGPGKTYQREGQVYRPLGDIFAENADTLFVAVTAPPECWQETDNAIAAHARTFNNWLKGTWLPEYTKSTGLHNVAVFDWFDLLASPNNAASHPNQLRAEYGGGAGDSHPNEKANADSTRVFATSSGSFIDKAWTAFRAPR